MRLDITRESWHRQTAEQWNSLPDKLRYIEGVKKFIVRLRGLVGTNVARYSSSL